MRLLMNRGGRPVGTTSATSPANMSTTTPRRWPAKQDENPKRIRLAGVVTLPVPGKGARTVRTARAASGWKPTAASSPPKLGDAVDVFGFPARRDGVSIVEDGVCQTTVAAAFPNAPRLTADEALSGAYHARLVSLDALVLEVSRTERSPTLVLQSGPNASSSPAWPKRRSPRGWRPSARTVGCA
jgi:hypothetical protein